MALKCVSAIIREERLVSVVTRLRHFGVRGMTTFRVTGYGEYINHNARHGLEHYSRVEIFLEESIAQKVAELIMETAHCGLDGDGIVAITHVDKLFRTRDQCEIIGK